MPEPGGVLLSSPMAKAMHMYRAEETKLLKKAVVVDT